MQRDTLIDFFRDLVGIRGEFLVYDDGYRRRGHSYDQVGRAARGFAARLTAAGLVKGDHVVFWGENRPEWIACYWGCLINGIVVVPIDYRSSVEFVRKVTTLVDARLVLIGDEVSAPREDEPPGGPPEGGSDSTTGPPKGGPYNNATPPKGGPYNNAAPPEGGPHNSAALGHGGSLSTAGPPEGGSDSTTGPPEGGPNNSAAPPEGGPYRTAGLSDVGAAFRRPTWRLADLDWHADGPMPGLPISRDDVIQVIFTSGATAEPKGVVIRHRNVLANIVPVEREVTRYRRYARPFHPLRFVNLLPLSHMFGQSMATNIPPMVRGTVIFTRSLNPHEIVRLIKSRRVSVLVCVPKILDVLREHIVRAFPEAAEPPPTGISIPGRWWRYRRVHRALGLKFWSFVVGAAPLAPELEEFWRRMGFAVIQGYGLTETAPIVTLNHPFKTSKGSVGTPIAGVEIKIAEDGEILVRGENVTSGYFEKRTSDQPPALSAEPRAPSPESPVDADGWLHTGDVGERDAAGRVFIKGRKKEMIVTPEGLNVFPEDVERVLNDVPGVRDSAVVGATADGQERVHAVVVLEPGTAIDAVVRAANSQLQDHQRVRTASAWPGSELPRTEGTRKLKRRMVRDWVESGATPVLAPQGDSIEAVIARFTRGREVSGETTLEELGLSSLERVELMVALEDRFQTRIDEGRFADAVSVGALRQLVEQPPAATEVDEPVEFPSWNRTWPVQLVRRLSQATWMMPLTKTFAWATVTGREHLIGLDGPVILAANHQSHMDGPVILAALPGQLRARVAPAMAKEFFKAHFFPANHTWRQRFTNGLNYYLAAFFFNAFPLPQREAGARQTLKYIGEMTGAGWSILIFPEGERSPTGTMKAFRGGIGMIASRLEIPVIPVRLDGVDRLMPTGSTFVQPGRVRVSFGAPLRLRGDDYAALAAQVEAAVRAL